MISVLSRKYTQLAEQERTGLAWHGIPGFRAVDFDSMSGGEIARVLIAGDGLREIEPTLSQAGFELRAVDPREVIAASTELAPDVLLLGPDIAPGRAIELLKSIGASGAAFPVILIGSHDSSRREAAFAAGAAECIAFPCGPVELAARVGRVARDEAQRRDLSRCAAEIDSAREDTNRLTAELEATRQEIRRVSAIDGLTGASNPRRFYEILEQEWKRAQRSEGPISLLLVDLDLFRLFNDKYGHALGDDCLRTVARSLQAGLNRGGDFLARWGGEEFIVLIPGGDEAQALALAHLLIRRVRELAIPHEGSPQSVVTVSVGVATVTPSNEKLPANLLAAAEEALRAAKDTGRDRVVVGWVR